MSDLKPCPFCGGKAVFEQSECGRAERSSVVIRFSVRCGKCGTSAATSYGNIFINLSKTGDLNVWCDEREKAVSSWNRRDYEAD